LSFREPQATDGVRREADAKIAAILRRNGRYANRETALMLLIVHGIQDLAPAMAPR